MQWLPDRRSGSCRYTKSVIRSRAALTYAEAQARIDDPRLHDEVDARPPAVLAPDMQMFDLANLQTLVVP
jgi:exoribonuclease R